MKITVEELDSMRERERQLEAKVERLQAENSTLKWSLHVGAYDVRQLQALDVQLQENVRRLRHARDSMAAADERLRREARVLGDRNTRLKQENDTLATRIRDLSRQVLEAVDGRVQSLREDTRHNRNLILRWCNATGLVYAQDHRQIRIEPRAPACRARFHETLNSFRDSMKGNGGILSSRCQELA
ncbi:hypothetical protein P8C59_006265 [Phyllachora maydis]|uniref:Uncharacterized protein n=1 Tax=Phyllachora maydis TaxID=1825666 RepID=A0AAD9I6E3_9PEZI|nr:hypothetical protein P8C59_006265 [Phyllachora maydis]